MRLASASGNSVSLSLSLSIDGYQYPHVAGSDGGDWDANWLMISATATDGDRRWSFRDPCLTTWEARDLGDWLRGVLSGVVVASPHEDDDVSLKVFTEPNLAFDLATRAPGEVGLRVSFSLEARPVELVDASIHEHHVELVLSERELSAAISDWDTELRAFPVRP